MLPCAKHSMELVARSWSRGDWPSGPSQNSVSSHRRAQTAVALAKDQGQEDDQVDDIAADACGKCRQVIAEVIIEGSRAPAARRHSQETREIYRRHPPVRILHRIEFTDHDHVGRQ